jgi:membrane protease YdiL (CAAX protease family)
MSTIALPAPATQPPAGDRLLAPWWHTLIVLFILLGVSLNGALSSRADLSHIGRLWIYVPTIIFQSVLVAFVWLGIRRRGMSLGDLVGGKWTSLNSVLLDGAIACGFWIVSIVVLGLVMRLLQVSGAGLSAKIGFLIPRNLAEAIAYGLMAVTAGFSEEIICRGYLQNQFRAMTGSVTAAVILQAIVFGAMHGFQGPKLMIALSVFGLLFGLLATWRKSLRPGMMAHAGQDLLVGISKMMMRHCG